MALFVLQAPETAAVDVTRAQVPAEQVATPDWQTVAEAVLQAPPMEVWVVVTRAQAPAEQVATPDWQTVAEAVLQAPPMEL